MPARRFSDAKQFLSTLSSPMQPLLEAARVTVMRNEANQLFEIELSQSNEMNLLVRPGDVITLHANATQFVYVGGEVKSQVRRRIVVV